MQVKPHRKKEIINYIQLRGRKKELAISAPEPLPSPLIQVRHLAGRSHDL